MKIKNVLFISNSVVFRKIVKTALSELLPGVPLHVSENEAETFDLVIIDDAINETFECSAFVHKIVLCEQKNFDAKNYSNSADTSFIVKPLDKGYDENVRAIKRGLRAVITTAEEKIETRKTERVTQFPSGRKFSLLLIAASTGGPRAVEKILSGMPRNFTMPVLLVQHMPAVFTLNFAAHMNKQFSINVAEAKQGDSLENGKILLAPGGFHMKVDSDKKIVISDESPVSGVRPSADVLFSSVAHAFKGENILAIVLTGMGVDGTDGLKELKEKCKCFCITQSEESCTVYGMPRSVDEAGLSDMSLDLEEIAETISQKLGG